MDATHPEKRHDGGCLVPLLAFGAVIAVLVGVTGVLFVVRSPLIVWRTSWTTTKGPRDLGNTAKAFKDGMPAAVVEKRLGPPETRDAEGDFEYWYYGSDERTRYEDRLLGLVKIGSGKDSSYDYCSMAFQGGRLVWGSWPGRFSLTSPMELRRLHRLMYWSRPTPETLPSRAPYFDPLGRIQLGRTTAKEVLDLVGAAPRIRSQGALERWEYDTMWETRGPLGTAHTENAFQLYLKDGVVVDSPRVATEDEALVREFAASETWPPK